MLVSLSRLIRNPIVIGILTCLIVVQIQSIASAQNAQVDTLNSLIKQNQDIEKWWDTVWQQTFNPGATGGSNLSDYMFNNIARWFILIGSFFWIWKLGMEMVGGMHQGAAIWVTLMKLFYPVVIVSLLLSNNAQPARDISSAFRSLGQTAITDIYNTKITDITLRDAMSDMFVTQATAAAIAADVQACSALPHPNVALPSSVRPSNPTPPLTPQQVQAYDYLHCVTSLKDKVLAQQQQAQAKTCTNIPGIQSSCVFLAKFLTKTGNSFSRVINNLSLNSINGLNSNSVQQVLLDYLGGLAAGAAYRPVLSFIQYWTISFMEIALFVDALVAPLAIAIALIPAKLNFTAGWIISMFTILLAKIVNAVMVGVAALQLSQSSTYSLSDSRFDLALGLLAPLCSFAVIGGGGIFAARTFMSTGLTAATSIAGVGTAMSTSIISGISRSIARKK
jgi:hypothetical protein